MFKILQFIIKIKKSMGIKSYLSIFSAIIVLVAVFVGLNNLIVKPIVKKRVNAAVVPLQKDIETKKDSLYIMKSQLDYTSLKLDSANTQATFNLQQVNRLQLEIRKIAKQNKELQKGLQIDLIKIRQTRWGKTLDSTYIENYQ